MPRTNDSRRTAVRLLAYKRMLEKMLDNRGRPRDGPESVRALTAAARLFRKGPAVSAKSSVYKK